MPFTRDYDGIKAVLDKVEDYDKTCLEPALLGISNLLLNEWDIYTPCQVVLVLQCHKEKKKRSTICNILSKYLVPLLLDALKDKK